MRALQNMFCFYMPWVSKHPPEGCQVELPGGETEASGFPDHIHEPQSGCPQASVPFILLVVHLCYFASENQHLWAVEMAQWVKKAPCCARARVQTTPTKVRPTCHPILRRQRPDPLGKLASWTGRMGKLWDHKRPCLN